MASHARSCSHLAPSGAHAPLLRSIVPRTPSPAPPPSSRPPSPPRRRRTGRVRPPPVQTSTSGTRAKIVSRTSSPHATRRDETSGTIQAPARVRITTALPAGFTTACPSIVNSAVIIPRSPALLISAFSNLPAATFCRADALHLSGLFEFCKLHLYGPGALAQCFGHLRYGDLWLSPDHVQD